MRRLGTVHFCFFLTTFFYPKVLALTDPAPPQVTTSAAGTFLPTGVQQGRFLGPQHHCRTHANAPTAANARGSPRLLPEGSCVLAVRERRATKLRKNKKRGGKGKEREGREGKSRGYLWQVYCAFWGLSHAGKGWLFSCGRAARRHRSMHPPRCPAASEMLATARHEAPPWPAGPQRKLHPFS